MSEDKVAEEEFVSRRILSEQPIALSCLEKYLLAIEGNNLDFTQSQISDCWRAILEALSLVLEKDPVIEVCGH